MHLINTKTLTLYEFFGSNIPPYAILSHRWEGEEVTFTDLQDGDLQEDKCTGMAKIQRCCAQAASDGWQYAWVDCCCIDRASSTELSEAINSMFTWYRDAQVCFAYLSDVPTEENLQCHWEDNSAFRRSAWFTRGWTLQELLAPKNLVFFDQNWMKIGEKSHLEALISSITGIKDLQNFEGASVAAKMSWAAKRETTRVEDKTYCLMGLFGVYMPPLYGEGENAFFRLQQEILRISDDESIFAWQDNRGGFRGVLALSPAAFKGSGDIEQHEFVKKRPPYFMTNKGLSIETHRSAYVAYDLSITPLNCRWSGSSQAISIYLAEKDNGQFIRAIVDKLCLWTTEWHFWPSNSCKLLYIKQYESISHIETHHLPRQILIGMESLRTDGFRLSEKQLEYPHLGEWNTESEKESLELTVHWHSICAWLLFSNNTENFVLRIYAGVNNVFVEPITGNGSEFVGRDLSDRWKSNRTEDGLFRSHALPCGKSISVTVSDRADLVEPGVLQYRVGIETSLKKLDDGLVPVLSSVQ